MREDQNVRLLRTITFVCSGSPCRRHPMRADGRQRDAPHCYPWISSQDADDSPAPSADTPLTSLRDVKGRWVGRYARARPPTMADEIFLAESAGMDLQGRGEGYNLEAPSLRRHTFWGCFHTPPL